MHGAGLGGLLGRAQEERLWGERPAASAGVEREGVAAADPERHVGRDRARPQRQAARARLRHVMRPGQELHLAVRLQPGRERAGPAEGCTQHRQRGEARHSNERADR